MMRWGPATLEPVLSPPHQMSRRYRWNGESQGYELSDSQAAALHGSWVSALSGRCQVWPGL